jgi:hypothetical protein
MRAFSFLGAAGAICVALLHVAPAQAQATRTWVSGVGDDVNPCSRTAPCKTFAGAISKTAPNGEISVLDPGGFGAVTITKGITLNGEGTLAGILSAGTNGINVAAAAADKIFIRNIFINGAGTGINGIRYTSGGQVTVEKVTISGFTNNGIDVSMSASGFLVVKDVHIDGGLRGIRLATTAGFVTAAISETTITKASTAAFETATAATFATIERSALVNNLGGSAVLATLGNGINVSRTSVLNNTTGFNAAASGTKIRVSDSDIYGNSIGFAFAAGATIESALNNRTGDNGGAQLPNGSIVLK